MSKLRRFSLIFSVFIVFFLLVFPFLAQDSRVNQFEFESGATIQYPEDWILNDSSAFITLIFEDVIFISVSDPVLLDLYEVSPEPSDDLLQRYFERFYANEEAGIVFTPDAVQELMFGERSAFRYDFINRDDTPVILFAIDLGDDQWGIFDVETFRSSLDEDEEEILGIASTFAMEMVQDVTFEDENATCTVSASRERDVQVHIGPGTNRTVIAFLPAGRDFIVFGEAEAFDGSIWYKLNKDEVAPDKSTEEVWIPRNEVELRGNCDVIVDAEPPPIIPFPTAIPTITPTPDSELDLTEPEGTATLDLTITVTGTPPEEATIEGEVTEPTVAVTEEPGS